jgi:hypothetical protein
VEEKSIGSKDYKFMKKAIISLLSGILLPVLAKARYQAQTIRCMSNQRQIINAVNFYAVDHRNKYPQSVATIGDFGNWNWQAPFVLTSFDTHATKPHRAMSEYLRSYIADASIMFCPNAPQKYEYLQQAWDAGDDWNNPDTTHEKDWVMGTYCFYWNYTGWLETGRFFNGPRDLFGGRRQSKLLVSDYFGFDNWRNQRFYGRWGVYGSCEPFEGANVTPGESIKVSTSAYWSRPKSDSFNLNTIDIKLHSGYTDGHVESFTASEVVKMFVIKNRHDFEVYEEGGPGPGTFYLPIDGLR